MQKNKKIIAQEIAARFISGLLKYDWKIKSTSQNNNNLNSKKEK